MSIFFFFFQAEDGIRDGHVTGVQTCALPIFQWPAAICWSATASRAAGGVGTGEGAGHWSAAAAIYADVAHRSEERRVGKECRSRWSAGHEKKKKHRCVEGSDRWGCVREERHH